AGVRRRCRLEFSFQISDSQTAERNIRTPIEGRVADCQIMLVGTVDRIERDRAIFDAATDWSNLVHRPTEAHRAVTTDTTIRRSQTGDSARRRWRHDRTKRLSADRETDQARGGRR